MPRTESIFHWVYGLDVSPGKFQLEFESVSDEDIPQGILQVRQEREKKSLESFEKNREKIDSIKKLHQWLYTEHAAYALSRNPEKEKGQILNSY
jgi:hypothetical protein